MPGYYKRRDLTEGAVVDGWLHSGDLGYVAKVVIMDDFPRNVAGKILKREMRKPYWEGKDSKI